MNIKSIFNTLHFVFFFLMEPCRRGNSLCKNLFRCIKPVCSELTKVKRTVKKRGPKKTNKAKPKPRAKARKGAKRGAKKRTVKRLSAVKVNGKTVLGVAKKKRAVRKKSKDGRRKRKY